MAKSSPTKEAVDFDHPSMCRENHYPLDQDLRDQGYEIASRPNVGEPTWRYGKHGKPFKQSTVLKMLEQAAGDS